MNMKKKLLALLLMLAVVLLLVLPFAKPAPIDHINNVKNNALSLAHQELTRAQLPEEYALQASMEAVKKVNSYLQTHMEVKDYIFVNVGMLNYHGNTYPITIGTLGEVYVLINEEYARKIFLNGWSTDKKQFMRNKK